MFSNLKQALVITRANLFSLPRRLSISLSMVVSIMLVVCVLTGFLAMANGFETALRSAGSSSVAVILGGGTNQESGSDVPPAVIRTLAAMTGDIGVVRTDDGSLFASREIVTTVDFTPDDETNARTLALRGMDQMGPSIRDNIALVEGRDVTPGSREIVVGARMAAELNLDIGRTVRLGPLEWTVVGHFSSNGSALESEIWADLEAVQSAFDRQGQVQSLRVRLTDPAAIRLLQENLSAAVTTAIVVVPEADLYAAQSGRTANLIRMFGWPLALLMAIGAIAGTLNTMMNSVSDRTVEIATIRTLGFSRFAAFVSTWLEAVVLAGAGVALGLLTSRLIFDGWQASTMGVNSARMAFQLTVTADVMVTAGLLGLAVGIIGGTMPALSATRLPLTEALRSNG